MHSLPLEFPLAMAFAEQLLNWKLEDVDGKSEEELDTIPASVLLQVVEILGESGAPCCMLCKRKATQRGTWQQHSVLGKRLCLVQRAKGPAWPWGEGATPAQ